MILTFEMIQTYKNGTWLPPVPYPFQARLGPLIRWKQRPATERMWLEGIATERRQ